MRRSSAAVRTALAALAVVLAALALPSAAQTPIPADHYSPVELNGFRATASYDQTIAFLLRLVRTSPYLKLDYFGTSGQGRRMPVVIVSSDQAFTPEEAWKTGKPVVLIQNSIHGGESDGTDACLILLRDLALQNRPEILKGMTLVVVPIYNVDGHERVSKYNRPNQNGPVDGMGFRTSARGLDLNRDYLKADAPETRALLALANAWKPDLFVDDHVTDGADFQATLTISYASEPFLPAPLAEWLRKAAKRSLREVEEMGWKTGPYVDFIDPRDPTKGIDPGPSAPRYATGYFPLRAVPSVLVETHAIKPFADRVKSNEVFLRALLTHVAGDPKALLAAREKGRSELRRAPAGTPVVLDSETDLSRPEPLDFPTYVWKEEVSPVSGKPVLRYDPQRKVTIRLPFFPYVKPKVTAPRPAAYLVPPGWPAIEERLKAHGIRYEKLDAERTLAVGVYRAGKAKLGTSPYQGRVKVEAPVERSTETRSVPAGTLYVPLDTELATIAMHLLEPESPDSLFAWGEMSSALEQKEYIDLRVLDPLAAEMLAKDPRLKAEWEEKLKDPAFAGNPGERARFFYRRTPYWDDTVGLLPVYRLEKPLPETPKPAAP